MDTEQNSLRELALFAGVGGGILGGKLLGWRTVCAVERDQYAAQILVARQNDGTLPPFQIWDDVTTFDGKEWRGRVDIITGGFPCQDISCAGKGAGIEGSRSGLWTEFARIIGEIRPKFAFVENSPMLVRRGIERVLGDLAALGYDAQWCVLGADDFGAPHKRKRLWILASDPSQVQWPYAERMESGSHNKNEIWQRQEFDTLIHDCPSWQGTQRGFDVLGDRFPYLVDEISAIGNAQVPIVAAAAFSILYNNMKFDQGQ